MRRPIRLFSVLIASVLLVLAAAGCGQEKYVIPRSDANYAQDVAAANIFHERCGGCHTLSAAAANGSGPNPRTYLNISGPNFNVRCERPVDRVLYAIENGGFSGAYMPQNIVVGQQAQEVAEFVSRFAGREAAIQPNTTPCKDQVVGTLPALPTSTDPTQLAAGVSTTASGATPTTTIAGKIFSGNAKDESQSNPSPNGGQ